MLNSAAFRLKTDPGPAGSVCWEELSRGKGLMRCRSLRCRRTHESSRYDICLSAALARYGRVLEVVDVRSKKGKFLL